MPNKMATSILSAATSAEISLYSSHRREQPAKKKMSITQTYYLAHTARGKLSKEAARPDFDLRVLVGHANLLDSLMLDLANAEKEQEQWFNHTVRNATKKTAAQPSHIRWADTIEEESMEDESDSDSDSSSDLDEDDDDFSDYDEDEEEDDQKFEDLTQIYTAAALAKPLRRAPSPPALISIEEVSSDEDDEELEEEIARLTLTRSSSRQPSPPELLDDLSSDDDDDDEGMPPSPEEPAVNAFSTSTTTTITTKQPVTRNHMLADTESQSLFEEEHDLYSHHQGTMIPAF